MKISKGLILNPGKVISIKSERKYYEVCKDCKFFEDWRFSQDCYACQAYEFINYKEKKDG